MRATVEMFETSRPDGGQAGILLSGGAEFKPETFSQKMKCKIDSIKGRLIYNRRLGTAGPVFAHIRYALGLSRFMLRGKGKVNTQWLLYCAVHNLFKVHRYGLELA